MDDILMQLVLEAELIIAELTAINNGRDIVDSLRGSFSTVVEES